MNQNIKCLSNCFSEEKTMIHPIIMLPYTLKSGHCFTTPYYDKNNIIKIYKKCDKNNDKVFDKQNLILPHINFDSNTFLSNIYGINDFSSGIDWLIENMYLPNATIFRFLNNFWEIYFDDIKINLEKIKNIYLKILEKNNKSNKNALINKAFVKLMNKYGKKYNKSIRYNDKLIKYIGI